MQKDLGIVGVSPQQLTRNRDRFVRLFQVRVDALKAQADEAPYLIVRRMTEGRIEDGQRLPVQAQLGIAQSKHQLRLREPGIECESALESPGRFEDVPLGVISQPQVCVYLGNSRLQLTELLEGPSGAVPVFCGEGLLGLPGVPLDLRLPGFLGRQACRVSGQKQQTEPRVNLRFHSPGHASAFRPIDLRPTFSLGITKQLRVYTLPPRFGTLRKSRPLQRAASDREALQGTSSELNFAPDGALVAWYACHSQEAEPQ